MLRPGSFALTVLLALLTGLGPLSVDMYLASLPSIGRLLGAPASQVQLTISFYLVGFACAQVLYGPLSDRHGRRPVLLAALGLYLVASLACALAFSIETLIAARFVQAVGASGAIVLARAVVRDMFEGSRIGREMSRMAAIMALAPLVAPLLGGVLRNPVRLALELRGAVLLRRRGLADDLVPAAGDAAPARARAGVACLDIAVLSPLSRQSLVRLPSRHRRVLPVRVVRLDLRLRLRAAGHLRLFGDGVRPGLRGGRRAAISPAPRSRRAL